MRSKSLLLLMVAAWFGVASAADPGACGGPIATWIDGLSGTDKETAYRCLISRDDAGLALQAALENEEDTSRRAPAMSRALALYLLERSDRAFTRGEIKSLIPADRRLVRDGLRARKGRESPAPNHDKVFKKFDWYTPDPAYTDARLSELDRENSRNLDKLPPPPSVETATAKSAKETKPDASESTKTAWYGCSSSGPIRPVRLALWVCLLGLVTRCRFTDYCR